MKIAVLGAGMVGRAIARDLSVSHEVTSFDISTANLAELKKHAPGVTCIETDLAAGGHINHLTDFKFVISAVPGFMGFAVLKTLIELGKDIVDISFFPEDAMQMDELAKEKGVTVITDCGVAPGMSNLILGHLDTQMKINTFECMVGGLPKKRTKPFEYKAPFSPVDVIEEYTRPARYVENGNIITKPALSDAEYITFENIGTLEAFNTDGLRSILSTMSHIPNMKEKTLRYPGHIDLIRSMQLAGFFSEENITINGCTVKPLDFTSKLLFNQWKLNAGEAEFTVMTIKCMGLMKGKRATISYSLYDEYDSNTGLSSMSRTTGFT